jgi:diacylglycerol O-acyltransferase
MSSATGRAVGNGRPRSGQRDSDCGARARARPAARSARSTVCVSNRCRRSAVMQSMSALDSLFLHFENDVSHMHLGAVALFEGPAPAAGEFAETLAGKLALLPHYRQRVRWVSWGLGRPVWVEDPRFELGYHLRHTGLPRPGGVAQLRALVGRVMAQPLDRRRPLWEMWVIEGAGAGRWWLVCKLHHCMVDGISAGDLLAVLLDPQPRMAASAPDRWQPSPEPSSASVLAHTLSERASGPARHLREARALLGAPGDTARRAITLAAGLSSTRVLARRRPTCSRRRPAARWRSRHSRRSHARRRRPAASSTDGASYPGGVWQRPRCESASQTTNRGRRSTASGRSTWPGSGSDRPRLTGVRA